MVGNVLTFQNQQRHMACHSKWKGKQFNNQPHLLLRTLTAAHSHPVGPVSTQMKGNGFQICILMIRKFPFLVIYSSIDSFKTNTVVFKPY